MADTPRTRAEVLTLFADNETGNISEQDLRDWVVTMMRDGLFLDRDDFWNQPAQAQLTTNLTAYGWHYSATMESAVSFGQPLYQTTTVATSQASQVWGKADAASTGKMPCMAISLEACGAGSTCDILRRGVVYFSEAGGTAASMTPGQWIYVAASMMSAGGIDSVGASAAQFYTQTVPTSAQAIGRAVTPFKFEFDPNWAIQ